MDLHLCCKAAIRLPRTSELQQLVNYIFSSLIQRQMIIILGKSYSIFCSPFVSVTHLDFKSAFISAYRVHQSKCTSLFYFYLLCKTNCVHVN